MTRLRARRGRGKAWAIAPRFIACFAACLAASVSAAGGDGRDTVYAFPADHGGGLSNPGMGWSFAFYSNHTEEWRKEWGKAVADGEDVLRWFPGCTSVFIRLGWSFFEPREGAYDWSRIDWIGGKWAAEGKKVAFTFVACNPYHRDTPDWVREAGARGTWIKVRRDHLGADTSRSAAPPGNSDRWSWCPDYDDPVFLAKFDRFLAAAAARYDGKPHVDFVEIGSVGSWGEGHAWLSGGRIGPAIHKAHIDMWSRHFRRTTLLVNDEFGRAQDGAPVPEALEHASRKGLGMADHSLQLGKRGNRSPDFARMFWPKRPVLLEHHNRTPFEEEYLDAVLQYHASYLRINTSESLATLPASWDVMKRINRRLGYRLQVAKAEWPSRATAGGKLPVEVEIRNAGVAPCLPGGRLAVHLRAGAGRLVTAVHGFDLKGLLPSSGSAPARPVRLRFELEVPAATPPGRADVLVSVGGENGLPSIALPHAGDDGSRRYRLGSLEVTTGSVPSRESRPANPFKAPISPIRTP